MTENKRGAPQGSPEEHKHEQTNCRAPVQTRRGPLGHRIAGGGGTCARPLDPGAGLGRAGLSRIRRRGPERATVASTGRPMGCGASTGGPARHWPCSWGTAAYITPAGGPARPGAECTMYMGHCASWGRAGAWGGGGPSGSAWGAGACAEGGLAPWERLNDDLTCWAWPGLRKSAGRGTESLEEGGGGNPHQAAGPDSTPQAFLHPDPSPDGVSNRQ